MLEQIFKKIQPFSKLKRKTVSQAGSLSLALSFIFASLGSLLILLGQVQKPSEIKKGKAGTTSACQKTICIPSPTLPPQSTSFNITVWDESTQRRWGTGNDCSNQKGVSLSTTLGSIVFTQDELGGHFDVVNLPLGQTLTITLNPPVSCGYSCGNWTLIKRSADLSSFEVVKTGSGCQVTLTPETQQWRTGLQFNLARQSSSPTPVPSPSLSPTLSPFLSPTPTPTPPPIPTCQGVKYLLLPSHPGPNDLLVINIDRRQATSCFGNWDNIGTLLDGTVTPGINLGFSDGSQKDTGYHVVFPAGLPAGNHTFKLLVNCSGENCPCQCNSFNFTIPSQPNNPPTPPPITPSVTPQETPTPTTPPDETPAISPTSPPTLFPNETPIVSPTASPTATLTPQPSPEWTAIIFFGGANNLDNFALKSLDVIKTLNNQNANIVAWVDSCYNPNNIYQKNCYTRQYIKTYDSTTGVETNIGNKNMGSPDTLLELINLAKNYPARKYYLSIADHGNAVKGISWDKNSEDFLTLNEIQFALSRGGIKFDIIHFDACLMSNLDVANKISDYADYVIAYENLGWSVFDYQNYLSQINGAITPEELARKIAELYFYHPNLNQTPHNITVTDLRLIGEVVARLDNLANYLNYLIQTRCSQALYCIGNSRSQSQKLSVTSSGGTNSNSNYLLDLIDFTQKLKTNCGSLDNQINTLADDLISKAQEAIIYHLTTNASNSRSYTSNQPFDLTNTNGLSLFFPDNLVTFQTYSDTAPLTNTWKEFLNLFFTKRCQTSFLLPFQQKQNPVLGVSTKEGGEILMADNPLEDMLNPEMQQSVVPQKPTLYLSPTPSQKITPQPSPSPSAEKKPSSQSLTVIGIFFIFISITVLAITAVKKIFKQKSF